MMKRTRKYADQFVEMSASSGGQSLLEKLKVKDGKTIELLRFISIFDKDYQNLWKPVDMRVNQDPDRDDILSVELQSSKQWVMHYELAAIWLSYAQSKRHWGMKSLRVLLKYKINFN